MTFVSYAQNCEDLILWRALHDVKCGFYVDVGAADPEEHSVTKPFYERGWSGINVEPTSDFFRRICEDRPRDINLKVAIGNTPGYVYLYELTGTGLSTLDSDIALRHGNTGFGVGKIVVPMLSLSSICQQRQGAPIHFLKIDVEGSEREVLLSMDFHQYRPWIVVVEATEPLNQTSTRHQWENILLSNNYLFAYYDGVNCFYVAHEKQGFIDKIAVPPNVSDDFIRAPELNIRRRLEQAEAQHAEAIEENIASLAQLETQHAETTAAMLAQFAEERAETHRNHAALKLKIATLDFAHQAELSRSEARLVALLNELNHERARAERAIQEKQLLLSSTAWRAMAPARKIASKLPHDVHWHLRRAMKAAWWAVTPWRMPRRIKFLRERRAAEGPPTAVVRDHDTSTQPVTETAYARWIREVEPRRACGAIGSGVQIGDSVRFSFLVPQADSPRLLAATLSSLRAQSSLDYEVLVAISGNAADARHIRDAVRDDDRVSTITCPDSLDRGGILARLTQSAHGTWVGVVDQGDSIAKGAFAEITSALADVPTSALLYGDEDELSLNGQRQSPQFKPGWSPELLHAYNYFGRLTLLSRGLVTKVGGFAAGQKAGAEWGLNLRAANHAHETGMPITRITRVLCHRAAGSDKDRPHPLTPQAADHREVLRDFWRKAGVAAPYVETQPDGTQRSRWEIVNPPLVSIIIPNHNAPDLLRTVTTGILVNTHYKNVEIIIVENRSNDSETWALYEVLERLSNVKVLRNDRPFNYSAACNNGAAIAKGELLLFLNNDIEVIDQEWLGELVRVSLLPGVGIAGTKLRYPTGRLQHGGVCAGVDLYGLMYNGAEESLWGLLGSSNHMRNCLAIMGACQMVRRQVFDRVGGFDEAYRIANSDIALCLKAYRAGWRTVYTPFAALVHHEGSTRGHSNPAEDMALSARELRRLGVAEDPYLHPELCPWDVVPRLLTAVEPTLKVNLQNDEDRHLAAAPSFTGNFDVFSDAATQAITGLPREMILWPAQMPHQVTDIWSAARFVIDLIRHRDDLRKQFSHALSHQENNAFLAWLRASAREGLGLPDGAIDHIVAMFAADLAAQPRQLYFWREDLRERFPLGLLPAGRRDLCAWLLREGVHAENLKHEEVWWFILSCAEDPVRELMRSFHFTPAWQNACPDGLTIFGRAHFASWVAERYNISPETGWLNPDTWPDDLSAVENIRLAYFACPDWRLAHPRAFATAANALALLHWLIDYYRDEAPSISAWCAARADDGTASALSLPGVNIIGHFCFPCGLRVSVEAMADAIETAGLPVTRRNIRTHRYDDPYHSEYGGLESHGITILHVQPEPLLLDSYVKSDLAEHQPKPYRIGYWYWELESVPETWAEKAGFVDEIWAATDFVGDALRKTVAVPVKTLFPGVQLGRFTRRSREAFGLPGRESRRFAFLFSFHMGSTYKRKNPLAVINAFKQAFAASEPVDLVIKTTSFGGHEASLAEIHQAACGSNIVILDQVMTPDDILALMDSCDAYVSLHRSEGLGLTMAEAMLLGKPVIATRYSGNLDFMNDENSLLVDFDLVEVGPAVPPYDPAALWADASADHAASLMRRLYENQAWARELGRKAQSDARRSLSIEVAGKRFAARLAEIRLVYESKEHKNRSIRTYDFACKMTGPPS